MTDIRPDGKGYIDEQAPPVSGQFDDADLSGSSEEEEEDMGDVEWAGEEPILNFPQVEEEDGQDWDVQDEDWELAHGDFTKQYNRLRQQHTATAAPSSVPLPARNVHVPKVTTSKLVAPAVFTGGVASNPKSSLDKHDKDKSDRATQEQVLDSRTRLVLASLVKRGVMGTLERCVSTGKEANVYRAGDVAVKIYRTSILNFRSRQTYIQGEHRFKNEYSSSKNPRKMVRVWAEKELRNLRRLEQNGIRSPKVVDGKENVLVMEYLGDVDASPRLRDADMGDRVVELYCELLVAMRRMYHHCKLVHADLSEYNVLLHLGHIYIIDVSQSVEQDHPRAYDFLRNDIRNVYDFFASKAKILGMRRMWDFITDDGVGLTLEEEKDDEGEKALMRIVTGRLEEAVDDAAVDTIFMTSYIPRNLGDVYDPERDVEMLKAGRGDELIYAGTTGLKEDLGAKLEKSVRFEEEGSEGEGEDEDEGGEGEEADEEDKQPRGHRHEDKEAKKERKKAVKEENREKRKTKMPKAEKQRLVKKSGR